MPILTWKDDYSVGIKKIDSEHKQLIAMLNTAYDAVDTIKSTKAVKDLRTRMEQYAATHFATEEALMKQYEFPDTATHVSAHQAFLARVQAADVDFVDDRIVPGTVKTLSFLAEWLVKHILATDKQLGVFLQEKGVE